MPWFFEKSQSEDHPDQGERVENARKRWIIGGVVFGTLIVILSVKFLIQKWSYGY